MDVSLQKQLSAFMERTRDVVINKVQPESSLEGKLDRTGNNVVHVQVGLVHPCVRRLYCPMRMHVFRRREDDVLLWSQPVRSGGAGAGAAGAGAVYANGRCFL